jgi:hypothetical protein
MKIVGYLVVLLIVVLAIPQTRVRLFEAVSPITDRVKVGMLPRGLEGMADQLEIRLRTQGPLTAGFTQWLRSGYSGSSIDPWGNVFYVKMGRRSGFIVGSMGPDGEQDTEDDVTASR